MVVVVVVVVVVVAVVVVVVASSSTSCPERVVKTNKVFFCESVNLLLY